MNQRTRTVRSLTGGLVVGLLLVAGPARATENGLARTPPMGWNSWNRFACHVNEQVVRSAADALVSSGMKEAGYQFVVIDDCWQTSRDPDGKIVADPQSFPSGIKALADYVHSKGLKFGIYSDAGVRTCAGRPGSRGHEYQDALQYAAWGVDYLKYDWCNTGTQDAQAAYQTMSEALAESGRPIVFSLCEWGEHKPWLWGAAVGNLWRTTGDISDCWECQKDQLSWTQILDLQVGLDPFAGPGHWNDPDMLEVGNGGMTVPEYRAHFSLWCLLAAPLMAGNDLQSMSPEIREILTNPEVISVDQDLLGRAGRRVQKSGDLEVWAKQLQDGSRAVALLNRGASASEISVTWEELGYTAHLSAAVRDLWRHQELPRATGRFRARVEPHGVVVVRVTP